MLISGAQFGQYEIVAPIGAGGMGEVYRARDTRLGRDVAVKVLPDAFSQDPDRLARFEREARLLAQLNHAHIATLHGLEEQDGVRFLVMELVDGETLAERIARGPLSVDEAIALFTQIAEGLEAAHHKGIIHRDLKPANVKITPEGKIKILDFGLAKAFLEEPVEGEESSQSPTSTKGTRLRQGFGGAGTELGVIMGTASYMSPEQARGKTVDKRTDVWAFGCCLYEALCGKKAFDGETATDAIAAVVKLEPAWAMLPGDRHLQSIVKRCLRKDPEWRLHDIADARIALSERPSHMAPSVSAASWRSTLFVLLSGMLISALAMWSFTAETDGGSDPVRRFDVSDPLLRGAYNEHVLALSQDGTLLAYGSQDDRGATHIRLRFMDQIETRSLEETAGARGPFLSPDGSWLGFFAGGQLKKIPVSGGPPVTLATGASYSSGADWGDHDWIAFGTEAGLARVAASGGPVEPLTNLESDTPGSRHGSPQILPGTETVLFTVSRGRGETRIEAVDVSTRTRKLVLEDASDARYSATGHLLFRRLGLGTLFATRFDADQLEIDGPAVPVLENVQISGTVTSYALSADGTLVYLAPAIRGERELVWVDRAGKTEPVLRGDAFRQARLSPDGKQLALDIGDEHGGRDIWIQDSSRDTLTRLTFDGLNLDPEWTADGAWILFGSDRTGTGIGIYRKRSDGSGEAEAMLDLDDGGYTRPDTLSPDGRILGFTHSIGSGNFGTFDLEERGAPELVVDANEDQRHPAFSPDGRFVAYASDISGRYEIYVQPFPSLDSRWPVSVVGGQSPVWARDGRELFYLDGTKMMAVAIETEEGFVAGPPRLLFDKTDLAGYEYRRRFDVAADGRFLMLIRLEDESDRMLAVMNFDEELKRLVPPN